MNKDQDEFFELVGTDVQRVHQYTEERILHFTCSECSNWWSYAFVKDEATTTNDYIPREATCPHCGHLDFVEEKD